MAWWIIGTDHLVARKQATPDDVSIHLRNSEANQFADEKPMKFPPHPVSREDRRGTYCEDYEIDGCSVDVCPEGCWQALKDRP